MVFLLCIVIAFEARMIHASASSASLNISAKRKVEKYSLVQIKLEDLHKRVIEVMELIGPPVQTNSSNRFTNRPTDIPDGEKKFLMT